MIQQANQLYEGLTQQLRETEALPSSSPAQRREHLLQHIRQVIEVLKQQVIAHTFPDEAEEILFFKEIKPKFTSLLIYHARLALIELKKPLGSLQDLRRHYENELLLIRVFYDHHVQLYQYLLSGSTYLDSRLFVRGKADLPYQYSTSSMDTDTRFSTHYDYIVARLEANRRLGEYLIQTINRLEQGQMDFAAPQHGPVLNWTGSKVYLIELAYGLYESGQINNGTADLCGITEQLETCFGVKLGNVYRTFQEVRQRKKDSRTKFLDLMRERLLHRMDALDGA
ncbi:RteC domain-containing protein [Pontibacter sp. HSC-14F20]|uniref:RteC domain-containing protein n=1 Tax=Pontibacter sp. HSC-14F20 TaxID=2864136 RepID=UPI001C72ED29|nr:RteC domain-containing protein [Pontibacter sp. HSC-14F20]MBX0335374.1 RteC domain-containing protein [Pontibacter sp. HSC-14F20]